MASLARSEVWRQIQRLTRHALRLEEAHRAVVAGGGSPAPPTVDTLLAALSASTLEGQRVARALAPALRELLPAPRATSRRRSRRERILMLLAVEGPLHASHIAKHLGLELPRVLYALTDIVRDSGEVGQGGTGLWGLAPPGWRAVRALASEVEPAGPR